MDGGRDVVWDIGIGTAAPTNNLSVTPLQYNVGTASQSLTNVTGTGTIWTSAMVGSQLVFANGVSAGTITAFGSATSLTVSASQTVAAQAYSIGYTGLQVASTGNVGIGTTAPSYSLHVVGSAGLSSGTAWTNASDIRLKDVHSDYEYGLDEILKLHAVRYSYKKDNPPGLPSDFSKTGFIAQEVQKVIPDAVNVDPIHWAVVNSIKDLYRKHILPLWENDKKHERAIASLKESNENLKKEKDREIASLKKEKDKEIAELKTRLLKVEKMIQSK